VGVDDHGLREAKAARARMEELEDATWDARAHFHSSVRRLHHGGASLREIAAALGMSHQRVHQIVGEDAVMDLDTGESRLPAVRPVEDSCTFCQAPRREVDRLLTGPGGTFVCGSCVVRARQSLEGGLTMATGQHLLTPAALDAQPCTFCRNRSAAVGQMVERGDRGVRICAACLDACERMLSPPGQYRPKGPAMKRRALLRCSFCNAGQKSCRKLVAGPGVYICDQCIAAAGAVIGGAPSAPSRSVVVRPNPADCLFCAKPRAKVRQVAGASRGRICNECLDVCHAILDGEDNPG
jgi:hypothetical protein